MKREEAVVMMKSVDGLEVVADELTDRLYIKNTLFPYFSFVELKKELWDGGKEFNPGISFAGSMEVTVEQAKKLIEELQEGVDKIEVFNQSAKEYFEKEKEKEK